MSLYEQLEYLLNHIHCNFDEMKECVLHFQSYRDSVEKLVECYGFKTIYDLYAVILKNESFIKINEILGNINLESDLVINHKRGHGYELALRIEEKRR